MSKENNIDVEEIETKIKDVVVKGTEVSKNAISKAGEAIQTFSDKSILKIERSQLASKRNKTYEALGRALSELYLSKKLILSAKNDDETTLTAIKEMEKIQKEIEKLTKQIHEKTDQLDSYIK